MKKMMVMLLALAMSISCLVLPAGAVQVEGNPCDTHMAVQPREFLQLSKTQRVVNNKKLNLVADITVKYTVRGEAANSSGFYITGIDSASAKKVSGWTSVESSVTIGDIVYSNNHQTAAVSVTYRASIGSGYGEYTATILIEM